MAKEFEDIKIVRFDDKAFGPSGQAALVRMVLRLSRSAPREWAQYFNQAWQQHLYMMKRRATASGDVIEIIGMPNELESDHLPEMKKVMAETNNAYRAYAANQHRQQEEAEAEKQRQKEELSKLKDRLKFD